jgi:hypothetical protein
MNRSFLTLLFFLTLFLQSCLYTSQHLQRARILAPGENRWTLGTAPIYFYEAPRDSNQQIISPLTDSSYVREWTWAFSLGYRLGLVDSFSVFPGVDLGVHFEVPTSPMSIEFDLRSGLPSWQTKYFTHTFSLGAQAGLWADFSWFAQYNAALHYKSFSWYVLGRFNRLATLPPDTQGEDMNIRFVSKPGYNVQAISGIYLGTGEVYNWLPNGLHLQMGRTYGARQSLFPENYQVGQMVFDNPLFWSVGLQWGL